MEIAANILDSILNVNSIWSVVFRGLFWFVVAAVIIISSDTPDPQKSLRNLKSNLGFLLLFFVLSGGLVYLLFGYMPGV